MTREESEREREREKRTNTNRYTQINRKKGDHLSKIGP